jgi:hypothetical protein
MKTTDHNADLPCFERTSKRRKGFPSETRVKRGLRFVRGGEKELVEKLGRNDPCPCGSGKRFQALLPTLGPVSTAPSGTSIGGEEGAYRALELALKANPSRVFHEKRLVWRVAHRRAHWACAVDDVRPVLRLKSAFRKFGSDQDFDLVKGQLELFEGLLSTIIGKAIEFCHVRPRLCPA